MENSNATGSLDFSASGIDLAFGPLVPVEDNGERGKQHADVTREAVRFSLFLFRYTIHTKWFYERHADGTCDETKNHIRPVLRRCLILK